MTEKTHAYTSITSNYLPKARVLAESIKQVDPSVTFHLVLSDDLPEDFDLEQEPFDTVIFAQSLPLENFDSWVFSHAVVELCTAVKGVVLEYIFDHYDADNVFYFDPDMVVFSRLDELQQDLSQNSILLTPHQIEPEKSTMAIMDNEMASLIYGVFNLGFVGVRNDHEGRRFSKWWAERLVEFCYDDRDKGLFTDQKWVNLAPCFFDKIKVLRSPAFNVATWNISTRQATGSVEEGILINGEPLGFYHFSGFDSGAQEIMLERYGQDSPVLFDLRNWYIDACEQHGQSLLGQLVCKYSLFDDGTKITNAQRIIYRDREDLKNAFPTPSSTRLDGGYKAWYEANVSTEQSQIGGALVITSGASFNEVVTDIAAYFEGVANSAKASNIFKRFLLRTIARCMRLVLWVLY